MKGHIRERGPGTWAVVIQVGRYPNGRQRYQWHTVKGGKRDAQRELNRLLAEMQAGSYVEPSRLTVAQYLEQWLQDYARSKVAKRTYEFYAEVIGKHLVPAFGNLVLAKLQPLQLQRYYSEAQRSGWRDGKGGLSVRSVLHHHRLLHGALAQAVRWQLIPRNPAEAVEPPRPEEKEMQVLDADGIRRLIDSVVGTHLYLPTLLAVATGLRHGEILGLRWTDLNLKAGTLTVNQSLEQTDEGLGFKAPKSRSSRRMIHLPPAVVEELVRHREAQADLRSRLGQAYEDQGLVLAWENGRPFRPHYITLAFIRQTRKLGLDLRFHDLRHTQATALIALGEQMKVISSRLGHSSVQITMDRYGHLLPGMDQGAAHRLDELFRPENPRQRRGTAASALH